MTSLSRIRLSAMRIPCSFAFSAALLALFLFAQAPAQANGGSTSPRSGCTLRIHVDGLRNSNGNLGTVLYTSPDGWPENPDKAFRRGPAEIPPGQRQATAVWENLPPGDYGVAAIHDENSNAKLDKNFFGIPKEGFGFANNPRIVFGPAAFKQALVHVTCPVTEITIHLIYK